MKSKAQKQKDLESLTQQFQNANSAMVVGFKGMTVAKDQELRNQFALNYNAQSQIAIDRIIEALYLTEVSRQDNSSCVDIITTLRLLIEKLQGY